MPICCGRCVLLGRGPCDGLILRPEEYYRVCLCTKVLISPQPGLLPSVFCLKVEIFRSMLVLYIYIYIYINK
jgi:hypothetical protein